MIKLCTPDNFLIPDTLHASVFLAGGISGCSDWQLDATNLITGGIHEGADLNIINPRQATYRSDAKAAKKQIRWEWARFRQTNSVIFWFTDQTIQPIALFELGKCLGKGMDLFIGAHPEYERRLDVEVQCDLEECGIQIHKTLESTVRNFLDYRWMKDNE